MNMRCGVRFWAGLAAVAFLAGALAAPAAAADKKKNDRAKADAAKDKKDKEAPAAAPAGDTAGFAALDTNSDGTLTVEEYLKVRPGPDGAPAVSPIPLPEQPKMRRDFEKMDKNRDRTVSELEYAEATAPKIKHEPPKQEHKKGNIRKLVNRARQLQRMMK